MVGGYICYYAMLSAGMDITTAAVSAMAGAGVVAVFTDRLAYRPIRERSSRTIYLMIASMGINIVIENIFVVTVGGRFRALPAIFPSGSLDLGGIITASYFDLFSLLISAIFLVILQLFLIKTKWGLAIRAAAYNLRTAGLMGVNVNRLIAIVFFVAGVLAAVGGIFLSARYTLYPQMGGITIKAFIAAVIGGLGSLPGAVMGSLVLGLAEMLTTAYISSQFRDILVFSMLILTLLFKPTGFFNKQIGEKV